MRDQLLSKAFEDYSKGIISSEELDQIKNMIDKLDLEVQVRSEYKKPVYIKYRGRTIRREKSVRVDLKDNDVKEKVIYRGSKVLDVAEDKRNTKKKTVIYRGVKV